MTFAASDAPLAYLECRSIGLSASQAKALAASACSLLDSDLCAVLGLEPFDFWLEVP